MLKRLPEMPATIGIMVLWVILYILNLFWSISPHLCGKGISKIDGEYYRFFTAGLIHTHWPHLLINCSAMLWVGYLFERRLGSWQFLLIAVLCAVAAQVIFLCIFCNAQGSIGGSCYPYALCGFGLVMSFLIPDFPKIRLGTWSGNWLAVYLIGANFPILPFMDWTAAVFHGIAFLLGAAAALLCWSVGIYKN